MRTAIISALLGTSLCLAAHTVTETFEDASSEARWRLHSEGSGRAVIEDGGLILDMSAPSQGKHAWAEFHRGLKLPAKITWRQKTVEDSPHHYRSGLYLQDATERIDTFGMCGRPADNVVHAAGRLGGTSLEPGRWYDFTLTISSGRNIVLTVIGHGMEETLRGRAHHVIGQLIKVGFFHNQPRDRGPDAYAQNRGISRVDDVQITAAAFHAGPLADYRDQEIRGIDPREPMTFNRAMTWVEPRDRAPSTVLAYDACKRLVLTGREAASTWSVNRGCLFEALDTTVSRFTRPNDLEGWDTAALRTFQWCLVQHPFLRYRLSPHGGAVRLVVALPSPYLGRGIIIYETAFARTPREGVIDLLPILRERGLDAHQFMEIACYLDQHKGPQGKQSTCDISLKLEGQGALITGPSLVRRASEAAKGITVDVILVDQHGLLVRGDEGSVQGRIDGRRVSMHDENADGIYSGTLTNLPEGTHRLILDGHVDDRRYTSVQEICVTNHAFADWQAGDALYRTTEGDTIPTLLGDLFAWVPMKTPHAVTRSVIATADTWRQLNPEERKQVALLKLRTLNRQEIAVMLDGYASNGVSVIRLTPNVTPRESYLDACGQGAPHGLELLSWVLWACRERGIRVVINLFHYPYWSPGTGSYPPWNQYIDAGYRDAGAFKTEAIRPLLCAYIADVLRVTRHDPTVLAYSLTGENDQHYGPEWVNHMTAFIRTHDPNHMITLEQGGGVLRRKGGVPWSYAAYAPATSAGIGYRTYYTGGLQSDAYMMICGRAYASNPPAFMAEVGSGPGWHGAFHKTWQHPDFLTKIRDAHWMAALCCQTMSLCWSAPWAQSECKVAKRCLSQLDWSRFNRKRPAVALELGSITRDTIARLAAWERLLASHCLDYDYRWRDAPADHPQPVYSAVIQSESAPDESVLPDVALAGRPFTVSAGRSVSILRSERPFQLLALIRNTSSYRPGAGYGHGVEELHRQRSDVLPSALTIGAVPEGAWIKLYDVDAQTCIHHGRAKPNERIDLGATAHDVAVLLSETPLAPGW